MDLKKDLLKEIPSPDLEYSLKPFKEVFAAWIYFTSIHQKTITTFIERLEAIAHFTEEKSLELTDQFQLLSSIALEQTKHLQNLTHIAKIVEVDNQEIEISTLSQKIQNTYVNSIGSIIEVSKQAVVMACIQDESLKTLNLIEKSIREIEQINNKTKYLSLNATIESIRAGEAGQSFQVVANEVRELSNDTQQMAINIRSQVNEMTNILGYAKAILQDITNIDMNQHILAKEQIDAMIDGLIKKNESMEQVMIEVTETMQNFSKTANHLIMSMQYQDRVKQEIQGIINNLKQSDQHFSFLIEKTYQITGLTDDDINELIQDFFNEAHFIKVDLETINKVPLPSEGDSTKLQGDILLF